jgi:hypothetical protein
MAIGGSAAETKTSWATSNGTNRTEYSEVATMLVGCSYRHHCSTITLASYFCSSIRTRKRSEAADDGWRTEAYATLRGTTALFDFDVNQVKCRNRIEAHAIWRPTLGLAKGCPMCLDQIGQPGATNRKAPNRMGLALKIDYADPTIFGVSRTILKRDAKQLIKC